MVSAEENDIVGAREFGWAIVVVRDTLATVVYVKRGWSDQAKVKRLLEFSGVEVECRLGSTSGAGEGCFPAVFQQL